MKLFPILLAVLIFSIHADADDKPEITIRFYEFLPSKAASSVEISDEDYDLKGFVRKAPDLEVSILKNAFIYTQKTYSGFPATEENVSLRTPSVMIEFTNEDAVSFAALTKRVVGKTLLVFVDGKVRSASRVREQIDSGVVAIPCKNEAEQKALVKTIEPLVQSPGEKAKAPKP